MNLLQSLKAKINQIKFKAIQKNELNTIGLEAKDIIYKRTKSGIGLTRNKLSQKRLDKLSSAYVNRRKKMILGEFGSPGKSNLTLTGQMLDNLDHNPGMKKVSIFIDSKNTNAKIAEYVEKNGRWFMGLTEAEIRILLNNYKKRIKLIARSLLK